MRLVAGLPCRLARRGGAGNRRQVAGALEDARGGLQWRGGAKGSARLGYKGGDWWAFWEDGKAR